MDLYSEKNKYNHKRCMYRVRYKLLQEKLDDY